MGRPRTGIAWLPHAMSGEIFHLDHLHPTQIEYVIPAKGDNPERCFSLSVSYGMHCFTRRRYDAEQVPTEGWYSDSRERRVFCRDRWELSRHLPEIIISLDRRKCLHTGREEFVTIKVMQRGRTFDYAVFFTVSKGGKSGADLNLFVNSAHERFNALKYTKPIGFQIILMNRYQGKKIRAPR